MTTKADFSPREWQTLLQAPGAAGMYIMMADRNFVIGSMKEALAVSAGILKREKQDNGELLSALLAEFRDREGMKQAQLKFESKDTETVQRKTLDVLREAVEILGRKASPEESVEIRQWLYDLALRAAEAAREGGFLGFGGTRVSEDEKAALRKIAWILGLEYREPAGH